MNTVKKKQTLSSALIIILTSNAIAVVFAVIATVYTGDWLYAAAGALFAVSGVAGIYVVRSLQRKIQRGS